VEHLQGVEVADAVVAAVMTLMLANLVVGEVGRLRLRWPPALSPLIQATSVTHQLQLPLQSAAAALLSQHVSEPEYLQRIHPGIRSVTDRSSKSNLCWMPLVSLSVLQSFLSEWQVVPASCVCPWQVFPSRLMTSSFSEERLPTLTLHVALDAKIATSPDLATE